MKHTEGKWIWEVGENRVRIFSEGDTGVIVSVPNIKGMDIAIANASHIVQMHNSHDGLLEACKFAFSNITESVHEEVIIERLREAITQAEEK